MVFMVKVKWEIPFNDSDHPSLKMAGVIIENYYLLACVRDAHRVSSSVLILHLKTSPVHVETIKQELHCSSLVHMH